MLVFSSNVFRNFISMLYCTMIAIVGDVIEYPRVGTTNKVLFYILKTLLCLKVSIVKTYTMNTVSLFSVSSCRIGMGPPRS